MISLRKPVYCVLKVLSSTTLVRPRKSDPESTSESTSDADQSHVFGVTATEHLAANLAQIEVKDGNFPEDLLSDSQIFPMDNSKISAQTEQDKAVDRADVSTEGVNSVPEDANTTSETTTVYVDGSMTINPSTTPHEEEKK